MIIQNLLIKWFLDPISSIMGKFPQKLRDVIFVLGGLGLSIHYFLNCMGLIPYRFVIFFVISCVFLGLMILGTLGEKLKAIKFNLPLFIPWLGVGAFMLLSGIINNINYLPDALLFLVVFPILYICWGNADRQRIFRLLLTVGKSALLIFIVANFFLAQITETKYSGIFSNSNHASFFIAVANACVLTEIFYEKKKGIKLIGNIILFGFGAALNSYTNSRSCTLALLLTGVLCTIMYFTTHKKRENIECAIRLGVTFLVSLVCINSVIYLYQLRQWLPIPYYDISKQEFYMDTYWYTLFEEETTTPEETTVESTTAANEETTVDEETTTTEETTVTEETTIAQPETTLPPETTTEPISLGNSSFEEANKDRYNATDADSFFTGRLSVWKAYATDLNLLGHKETPTITVDSLHYKEINTTHMTILQVAYESGIPAGILYLIVNLASGIFALIFAVKHKEEKYALMPLILIVVFGVLSMVGSARVTFWHYETIFYYLALFPIMIKYNVNSESSKK